MAKREDRLAALKGMGLDVDGILARVAELKAAHTVEKKDEAGKVVGLIKPDGEHLLSLVKKTVTVSDTAPIEAWLENEIFELSK